MAATSNSLSGPVWGDSFLLNYVKWETYESLLKDFDAAGSNIRMTYDGERLEFRAPDFIHEHRQALVKRMVHNLTCELYISIRSGGSTTFRDRRRGCGLDPDECFWITHEEAIRRRDDAELDLDIDPPADLVIDIENTRQDHRPAATVRRDSAFPRSGACRPTPFSSAGFRSDGSYTWGDRSVELPMISTRDLEHWLSKAQWRVRDVLDSRLFRLGSRRTGPPHRKPDPEGLIAPSSTRSRPMATASKTPPEPAQNQVPLRRGLSAERRELGDL